MTAALHEEAPAKVNLCLFLGPRRASDGRHELVTVFQPVTLADRVALQPAPLGADADAVSCPGVAGPPEANLAAAALRAFRARTGWAGPPVRLHIDKRIPVAAGMAGGSADAGAALRLASRVAGVGDDDLLREVAFGLGADVPAQVRPARYLATGAGEALRALEGPPADYGILVLRVPEPLSTADVYRRADEMDLARGQADLARAAPGGRGRRCRPARRSDRQRPRGRRPRALPRRRRRARVRCGTPAPSGRSCAARARPSSACSPASMPRAGRRSPSATGRRGRSSPRRGAGPRRGRRRREARLARRRRCPGRVPRLAPPQARADADRRRGDRRGRDGDLRHGRGQAAESRGDADQRRRDARPVDLSARGRARVPRDRRVHRPDRPGRDGDAAWWPCRGPGADQRHHAHRRRVGVRRRRGPDELLPRPPPRPPLPRPARQQGPDHGSAAAPRRGVLRPSRRQGDPHRPLRRPRARDRAVHRGVERDAPAPVPALRHRRRGPVGLDVRPARLHLLAELRAARRLCEEGGAGPRDGHRPHRRDRVARALGAPPREPPGGPRLARAPGRAAGPAAVRDGPAAGAPHQRRAGPVRRGTGSPPATSASS